MTGHNIDVLADWIMRDALFDLPDRPAEETSGAANEAAHA